NIVTFGDSIMWGQGLSEAHKFRNIVASHIRGLTTRPVTLTNFARSGAHIESRATSDVGKSPTLPASDPPSAFPFLDSSAAGEVPWSLPSVTRQSASPQGVDKGLVDLVLM